MNSSLKTSHKIPKKQENGSSPIQNTLRIRWFFQKKPARSCVRELKPLLLCNKDLSGCAPWSLAIGDSWSCRFCYRRDYFCFVWTSWSWLECLSVLNWLWTWKELLGTSGNFQEHFHKSCFRPMVLPSPRSTRCCWWRSPRRFQSLPRRPLLRSVRRVSCWFTSADVRRDDSFCHHSSTFAEVRSERRLFLSPSLIPVSRTAQKHLRGSKRALHEDGYFL